jgi:ADP-heptose:LPS heptosyltransferase
MRVLSFKNNLEIDSKGREKFSFKKDEHYIFTEAFASEISGVFGNLIETNSLLEDVMKLVFEKPAQKIYSGQDLTNKKLFCFKSAGIGDMMAMMVAMRHLKTKYPSCELYVGSNSGYRGLFETDPAIKEFVAIPYPFSYITKCDYFIYFQDILDGEGPMRRSLYDLFADRMMLTLSEEEKFPKLYLKEEIDYEMGQMFEGLKTEGKRPIVGIQLQTSTVIRDYPPELWAKLVGYLTEEGIPVVLLGEPESNRLVRDYFLIQNNLAFNLCEESKTMQHFLAIVKHCDFIISADTSTLHLAGALGKPMIGIFGPIPSPLRISYFKNAVGIDCKTLCSPCFLHGHFPCRFSVDERGYSPCMRLASPEKIMEVVEKQMLPLFGVSRTRFQPAIERKPDERRAIVTVAIGEPAKAMLEVARPFFDRYAQRTNSEFIVIDQEKFKIVSPTTGQVMPNLEKFQMREMFDTYDRIAYFDVDILIHPQCPDLFNMVPEGSLGAVPDCPDGRWGNLNRLNEIMAIQQQLGSLEWTSGYFNSGVLIMSKRHRSLFDHPEIRAQIEVQFRDQTLLNYNFRRVYPAISDFYSLDKKFNAMEINGYSSRGPRANKIMAMVMHFAFESPKMENMQRVADMFLRMFPEMKGQPNEQ